MRARSILMGLALAMGLVSHVAADDALPPEVSWPTRDATLETLKPTIAALEKAAKARGAPVAVHESLVRALYFQATLLADGSDEQMDAYKAAVEAGLRGIAAIDGKGAIEDASALEDRLASLDKRVVGILYWTAISYGSSIPGMWKIRQLGAAPRFEKLVVRCVELDEKYFHGGPHRALAGYLAEAPGALGGDEAEARKHCEKAVEIDPKFADNLVQRAESDWKPAKEKAKYEADLRAAMALADDACADAVAEQKAAKKRAAELLKKMGEVF